MPSSLRKLRALSQNLWNTPKYHPLRLFLYCGIVAALFNLTPRLLSISYGNVDPSFVFAFNKASTMQLSFGDQFISTYGPLGYLLTSFIPQTLLKASIWHLIFVWALSVGVWAFTLLYIQKSKARWPIATIMLFVLSMTIGGVGIEWNYVAVFLLYGFIYLRAPKKLDIPLIIGLAAVAAIFSFIKFTLGFGTLATIVILCLTSLKRPLRKQLVLLGGAIGFYAIALLIFGNILGIQSISAYIHSALVVSGRFSSAMAMYNQQTAFATIFLAAACILLIVWPIVRQRPWQSAVRYAFILPALLLIWKYSVARQDGHLLRSLQIVLPLAVMLYYSLPRTTTFDRRIVSLIVTLAVLSVWANKIPFTGNGSFMQVVTSPIANVKSFDFISFARLGRQKLLWQQHSAAGLQGANLSSELKQTIGNGSVDVFPWETVVIAANNVNWQPRPSPFSFETYDPYLDNANAHFYSSKAASDFIVWHNTGEKSIDYRHLLWDEPATFRTIIKHYSVVARDKNFLLLKRRPQPLQTQARPLALKKSASWQKLPDNIDNQLLFSSFTIKQSIGDELTELLLRSKTYSLEFQTKSGREFAYQVIKENSSQGLLVTELPRNWDEMARLLEEHAIDDDPIVAYRLREPGQTKATLYQLELR